jgi:hypothetical protein
VKGTCIWQNPTHVPFLFVFIYFILRFFCSSVARPLKPIFYNKRQQFKTNTAKPHVDNIEGPPKQNKKRKQGTKNNSSKKQPTDLFSFFFWRVKPYARRLWTYHRMRAPAVGCGVFLYELVPSGDPFVSCLCETIVFAAIFLFPPKNK